MSLLSLELGMRGFPEAPCRKDADEIPNAAKPAWIDALFRCASRDYMHPRPRSLPALLSQSTSRKPEQPVTEATVREATQDVGKTGKMPSTVAAAVRIENRVLSKGLEEVTYLT